ncbi:helix-turn-helix domain-containing protein [Anaerotruncus rubiinfantis]|uniref:helix-turn-helix domain-containing protein n=1 Tax=Anaerotruncus rubiinfantis TaxID=1720200 RepID=UPI003D7A2244
MYINDTLGKRIKQLRQKRHVSQEHLAYHSGLSVKSLNRIENGNGNPTLCSIVGIAQALEVEPYELLKEDSEND